MLGGAPRTALVQISGHQNAIGSYRHSIQRCTLKPTSYFEECLDTPDLSCVESGYWTFECHDEDAPCPGG